MAQYDKIAKNYKTAMDEDIVGKYGFIPHYLRIIGDLKEKSVLDLACGEGLFTRKFKKKGAMYVEGVDISKEMIALAKKNTDFQIKYHVYDVTLMPQIGQFDIVTASWLLHYAKSQDELAIMYSKIAKNLKKKGKFIGLIPNPDHPILSKEKYRKYRIISKLEDEKLYNGCRIKTILYDTEDKERTSFYHYYWDKETYLSLLRKAGFTNVKVTVSSATKEGIQKYGKEFWEYYNKFPESAVIYGEKS